MWRVKAAEAYPQLKERSDRGALSSADLYWLYGGAESYFELRDRLLPYTQPYVARFAAEGAEPPLGTPAGQLMMKKIKLNLAVGLVLYDNYMVGVYPYYADAKFRRLLRRDRPRPGRQDRRHHHELSRRHAAPADRVRDRLGAEGTRGGHRPEL